MVYAELCEIVDEWIEIFRADGKPLPPPTSVADLTEFLAEHNRANALEAVAAYDLHKSAA